MHAMESKVAEKLEFFFSQFKPLKIRKGQIIYRPEDEISNIYLIRKGLVRQYSISENGDEVTINFFRPNSFFPIMLILSNQPNKYFFEAQSDLDLFQAPFQKVLEFLQKEPTVLFDLTKRFAAGLNGLSQRLSGLMFENAARRVTSLLVYLSKKFGEEKDGWIIIQLPLTHQDIASWVNLTRETASRKIENLVKLGIISHNNKLLVIKDIKKLEGLL